MPSDVPGDTASVLDGGLLSPVTAGHDGTVTDAKTLVGLLWLQNVLAGTWQLDWRT